MIENEQYRPMPLMLSRRLRDQCHGPLAAMALLFSAFAYLVLPWPLLVAVPLLLILAALAAGKDQLDGFPQRQDKVLMMVLLLYGVCWVVVELAHGMRFKGVRDAWPIWLAMVTLVAMVRLKPSAVWFWTGLALGSISAGAWAFWQRIIQGTSRADGQDPLHAILFGNLGLMTGLLCLAGLSWAMTRNERWRWILLMALGGLAGLMASAMSGSRGGWIGLPLAIWVLYRGHGKRLSLRWRLMVGACLLALLGSLYMIPQTGVAKRVHNAVSGVQQYVAGDDEMTSVSARLEMWKGASQLIAERPIVGWGTREYRAAMRERGAEGAQDPSLGRFWHAHNDVLDAWVKRGLPGLLTLLALYMTPLWLFARGIGSASGERRALAVAGTLLPVAFIDFGLTYSFLAYPMGGMVYALLLVILWGLYRRSPPEPQHGER
ncbi:O-antigen ligase family protein [Halomonas sp. M5N1S17]|uniref:O-antigen ligase family protein n=1 Tax=Halomonas alkalisoli TaxID=2907158 RepID=UPI001F416E6E|nr:O-antigen ligase family protein [Halomonas alkalisoli]MCE9662457.1 O-antigen ligase family protein [Halomonas alkalisoli]